MIFCIEISGKNRLIRIILSVNNYFLTFQTALRVSSFTLMLRFKSVRFLCHRNSFNNFQCEYSVSVFSLFTISSEAFKGLLRAHFAAGGYFVSSCQ